MLTQSSQNTLAGRPLSPIQLTLRKCVYAFNGTLRRSEIAKLLIGSKSVRIDGLQESEFFGQLPNHTRKSIIHHLDILTQQGLLHVDVNGRVSIANNHVR